MKTINRSFTVYLLLAALCLAAGSGCGMKDFKPSKMFSLDSAWPFGGDGFEEGTPARVVGAWTDTVMSKQGQSPQRGFGGRLAFYDGENEKAIKVDGELVVYAFNETNREPTDNKPTRRYVFPADQMNLRMSESELGATYSFWLPWDEAGGPQTEVSLICRFQPKKGSVVVSEQTRHRLPGSLPAVAGATTPPQAPKLPEGVPSRPARPTLDSLQSQRVATTGTQLASYESPAEPQAFDPNAAAAATAQLTRQMTVTSISLPDNFQLHDFAGAAQNAAPVTHVAAQPTQTVQRTPAVPPQAPPPTQPAMQMQPQMNGAYQPSQQPVMPQQPQYQQQYQPQQYPPAASMQPSQPALGMPRVQAPQVYPFGNQVSAPQPIVVPQPLPMQPAPQATQLQTGQPMPTPTPMQTTVSYPNQVIRR
jgi:hypothetical protein